MFIINLNVHEDTHIKNNIQLYPVVEIYYAYKTIKL